LGGPVPTWANVDGILVAFSLTRRACVARLIIPNLCKGLSKMMHSSLKRLGDYLTVSEAACILGVSPWTLRNWDKANKLKPRRHPLNGYRLYRREDLEALLLETAKRPKRRLERQEAQT
jgi:hypothetical protein